MEQARARAEAAMAAAQDAQATVMRLQQEAVQLAAKVDAAVTQLVETQSDAERVAAKAQLQQLNHERAELERRMAAARETARSAERRRDVPLSKECLDDPLAPGCS